MAVRVLDTACRLITPFLLLFAVYVVVHGHDSPGGGFQGGTIAAAVVILVRIVRDDDPPWFFDSKGALICACSGLGLFVADGGVDLLFGRNFLDEDVSKVLICYPLWVCVHHSNPKPIR